MEVNGNKETQMVVVVGTPTHSQLNRKGKNVAHAHHARSLPKRGVVEVEQGMIVKDTKKRRAQIGLEFTEGPDMNDSSSLMNIDVDPKNGLAVGHVFQTHRQQ